MARAVLIFSFIFLIVAFVYYPVLFTYFSHDDFFHFKVSQTNGTVGGFLNLFGFHPFGEREIAFYRPVFREGLFNIFYSLFGLNALPFRVLSLLIHGINILLVYILMQKLFNKRKLALFVAFFFGLSAGNVGSLYYLAGGIQSLGATMFILLSVILFLNRKVLFSFLTFLLALGSHELSAFIPLVFLGFSLINRRPAILLWPFFTALLIFIYLDFSVIGFSSTEQQYKATFSPKAIFNSLAWYISWAFGFPEMFLDFIGPKFSINPNLMKFWGDYVAGIFFFGLVAATVFVMNFLVSVRAGILKDRKFWVLLFWLILALSPVIIFPLHKSTYYLNPALPAFWGLMGLVTVYSYEWLKKINIRIVGFLIGAFMASAISLSFISVALAKVTYPAANRGRIAEKLVGDIQIMYPQLPKGAVIYIKNDPNYPKISGDWGGSSKQAAFVLNGSDALQLVYKDPNLRVVYEDFDRHIPDGAYLLVARIN